MNSLINPIETLLAHAHSKGGKKFNSMMEMGNVDTIILAGGEGKRLFPFTTHYCKPAINFGGRYRIIDIPISNAINSGCRKIYVIAQFLTSSLQQHLVHTYCRHNNEHNGLTLLCPEQKPGKKRWFEGTADAVRQNLDYLKDTAADYFLILSGDQLYQLDFRHMLNTAKKTGADLVVATLPIKESDCKRMGILQIDNQMMITQFTEKTKDPQVIKSMELSEAFQAKAIRDPQCHHLASMGIYLFKKEALIKLLSNEDREDFGMHLLPTIIEQGNCAAYLFNGYWEDIGTIESFYQANIDLTQSSPLFHCHNENWPIYCSNHCLPPAKINASYLHNTIIGEGCLIEATEIADSIIGPRTHIQKGTVITASYLMGYDYHPAKASLSTFPRKIGQNCIIQKAIIDKDVSIGNDVQLINKEKHTQYDSDIIYVRNGIITIPHGATIPDGFIF